MLITVGEVCEYDVVTVSPETPVREAAQLMSERNIGALVVVDDVEEKSSLRGMLTDRDIVMRLLAEGVDVENTTVSDAMTTEVEAVNEGQTVQYALQCMQDKGIRRMPVVDEGGKVCGILALDDIVVIIADQLKSVADLIRHQICSQHSQECQTRQWGSEEMV